MNMLRAVSLLAITLYFAARQAFLRLVCGSYNNSNKRVKWLAVIKSYSRSIGAYDANKSQVYEGCLKSSEP